VCVCGCVMCVYIYICDTSLGVGDVSLCV